MDPIRTLLQKLYLHINASNIEQIFSYYNLGTGF